MAENQIEDLDLSKVLADADLKDVPDEEKLARLSTLARQHLAITAEIDTIEKELEGKKEELKKVSETDIPELFDELGIDEFRLRSGVKVQVDPYFSGKITGPECYEWLNNNNYGDLIKGSLVISYPKGFDQDKLRHIVELAKTLGLTAENQEGVHHSTLKAWIKDMVTRGKEFPREMFHVYVGRKTKLTLK